MPFLFSPLWPFFWSFSRQYLVKVCCYFMCFTERLWMKVCIGNSGWNGREIQTVKLIRWSWFFDTNILRFTYEANHSFRTEKFIKLPKALVFSCKYLRRVILSIRWFRACKALHNISLFLTCEQIPSKFTPSYSLPYGNIMY